MRRVHYTIQYSIGNGAFSVLCTCGKPFTRYTNRKKFISYYICNNTEYRTNVSAQKMNEDFYQLMQRQIPLEIESSKLTKSLSEFIIAYNQVNLDTIQNLRGEIKAVEQKQDKLTELVVDGTLNKNHFHIKFTELEEIKLNKTEKIEEYSIDLSNHEILVKKNSGILSKIFN